MQDLFGPIDIPQNFPKFFSEPHQSTYVQFRKLKLDAQLDRVAEIITKANQGTNFKIINWTDEDKVILIALHRTSIQKLEMAFFQAQSKIGMLAFHPDEFLKWVRETLNYEAKFDRPRNASPSQASFPLASTASTTRPQGPVRTTVAPRSVNADPTHRPASRNFNLRPCLTGTANFFWKNRNAGQRTGEILFATAGLSAIFGAVSAQSTALTAVGSAASKFLPSFVASFGLTHAIPPAALAFYALAGVLAAAALVLLIASTLYQRSHKPKNDHFVFQDWNSRPRAYH